MPYTILYRPAYSYIHFLLDDTVAVQWLGKDSLESSSFRMVSQTSESTYDLEPHFVYGSIKPKEIVYRSVHCRLPDPLFTVGWVRQITLQGQIIVVSLQTKQEHSVFPPEIETTGMKINSDANERKIVRPSLDMLRLHGLNTLRMSDQYFSINVHTPMDWSSAVPETEHFKLVSKAPSTHAFFQNQFATRADGHWFRAVRSDQIVLNTEGNEKLGTVWIKGFGNRIVRNDIVKCNIFIVKSSYSNVAMFACIFCCRISFQC